MGLVRGCTAANPGSPAQSPRNPSRSAAESAKVWAVPTFVDLGHHEATAEILAEMGVALTLGLPHWEPTLDLAARESIVLEWGLPRRSLTRRATRGQAPAGPSQGFSTGTPSGSKSTVFRVTTVRP